MSMQLHGATPLFTPSISWLLTVLPATALHEHLPPAALFFCSPIGRFWQTLAGLVLLQCVAVVLPVAIQAQFPAAPLAVQVQTP